MMTKLNINMPKKSKCNNISERINQPIGIILRHYKGKSFKVLKQQTTLFLTTTPTATLNTPPYEIVYKRNTFNHNTREITLTDTDILNKIQSNIVKGENRRNYLRTKH